MTGELKHNYIGTEHLLLGLLREPEGLASRVLEEHGVTEEKILRMIQQWIGEGSVDVADVVDYTPPVSYTHLDVYKRQAIW